MQLAVFSCQGSSTLLASSGQGPEVLLNTLPCTGQSPTMENYPVQNASGAKVEKPGCRII